MKRFALPRIGCRWLAALAAAGAFLAALVPQAAFAEGAPPVPPPACDAIKSQRSHLAEVGTNLGTGEQAREEASWAYQAGCFALAMHDWQYLVARDDGAPDARYWLGVLAEKGQGEPQNFAAAIAYYRQAAAWPHHGAALRLAQLAADGKAMPQDWSAVAGWLRAAAGDPQDTAFSDPDAGYVSTARTELGMLYEKGRAVPQDYAQAARWYLAAAQIEADPIGQARLAALYEAGRGVPQDDCKAEMLYSWAADKQDKDAAARLAAMKAQGRCHPASYRQALALYRQQTAPQTPPLPMRGFMAGVLCDAAELLAPTPAYSPGAIGDDCDSLALYYGIGRKPDYIRARRCALREADKPDASSPLSGAAVLAAIYANGRGTPRNLSLATHYACEAGGAPAEVEGRIAHLVALQAGAGVNKPFTFCDDITSGYMEGFCAGIETDKSQARGQRTIAALEAGLSPGARRRLATLKKAAANFFDAQSSDETDMSGTARAAMVEDQLSDDRKAFLAELRLAVRHGLPPASGQDVARAAAALDQTLAQVKAAPSLQPSPDSPNRSQAGSTVVISDILEAQALWVAYRDAWAAFLADQPPGARAALLVHVIRNRTAQLSSLLP